MRIWSKHIKETLRDIEEFMLDEYKLARNEEEKKRDWRTYEQRLAYRIKGAIRNLEPLIGEAVSTIKVRREKGRKPALTLEQKVTLLLLKQLIEKSNRNMSFMIDIFSIFSGIDISYKTVERLYSDPEVEMALHNLHILILKKKGIKDVDATGDGTGYSLIVRKHYASETKKRKEKVKSNGKEKKAFVYSFKLMDLDTLLYVCYGASLKSEKEAFDRAMIMLPDTEVRINSVRLDKYYSFPTYVDKFGEATVYIIPRKDATLKGSWKWKRTMFEFIKDTIPYMMEYYRRNHSEADFSADKRGFGWKVGQKREDRINTATVCTALWHNLFNLY